MVSMLERALASLVTDPHFEAIATAAALKELPLLRRACVRFGAASTTVGHQRGD